MTSSARPSKESGTVRPSELAVFMLITSSSFVNLCCTGRFSGFPHSALGQDSRLLVDKPRHNLVRSSPIHQPQQIPEADKLRVCCAERLDQKAFRGFEPSMRQPKPTMHPDRALAIVAKAASKSSGPLASTNSSFTSKASAADPTSLRRRSYPATRFVGL
jgi:hypothetical protein